MIWIVLVFGLMGALGIAYAIVYLWTLPTSAEDLRRLRNGGIGVAAGPHSRGGRQALPDPFLE